MDSREEKVTDLIDNMLNKGQVKSETPAKLVEELPEDSVGKVLVNFLLKEESSSVAPVGNNDENE